MLPLPQAEASVEEQMELMGWANDDRHAALILTGTSDVPEPLLYTPEVCVIVYVLACEEGSELHL